ncbi:CAP-associated domain-containing protein [Enterococcus casseliflavus]|uniref:CAP domain-containing protein n=1 Tax=Enterococcus casseliflavus TaxID=37734 RepID=UPI003D6C24D7
MKKLKFLFKSIFLIGLLYFASQMITWHDGRLAFRDARLNEITQIISSRFSLSQDASDRQVEKTPAQTHLYNESRQVIEETFGEAINESANRYGLMWTSYHDDFRNFMMVMYDENDIAQGIYTNQDTLHIDDTLGIGSSKASVRNQMGTRQESFQRGSRRYRIQPDANYDLFLHDDQLITFFYDVHAEDTVTAIQIINQELEVLHADDFRQNQTAVLSGLRTQLFELTNATRVKFGLEPLEFSAATSETARKHSQDMAENRYFDHIALDGSSPFDRMQEHGISFTAAGENLAFGQASSIYAHQGLMNSEGHRATILTEGYDYLGIGIAIDTSEQPYYTTLYHRGSAS